MAKIPDSLSPVANVLLCSLACLCLMFSVQGACVGGHCPQAEIDGTSMLARHMQLKPSNTVLANITGADTTGFTTGASTACNIVGAPCCDSDNGGVCNVEESPWIVCNPTTTRCEPCGISEQVCCSPDGTMKGPRINLEGYCRDRLCNAANTCLGHHLSCGKRDKKCCTHGLKCHNGLGCHKGKCIDKAPEGSQTGLPGWICSTDMDCDYGDGRNGACIADPTDPDLGKLCFYLRGGSCGCTIPGVTRCSDWADTDACGHWGSKSNCGLNSGTDDNPNYQCCAAAECDIEEFRLSYDEVDNYCETDPYWEKPVWVPHVTGKIITVDGTTTCGNDGACKSTCKCTCKPWNWRG